MLSTRLCKSWNVLSRSEHRLLYSSALRSPAATSACRCRSCARIFLADSRFPSAADFPALTSWSVTSANALTTTMGRYRRCLFTSSLTRRMAAASSTEVPPNFITTKSDRQFTASLFRAGKSLIWVVPFMFTRFGAIKNPPAICFWRWVLLPVQNLMFLSSPGTLPQKTRNSCRCAHRCNSHGLLGSDSHFRRGASKLVLLLPAVSGCGRLRFESFLEKLDQSINQSAAAANDVQTAFVLVLFENLIKAAFQLLHTVLL